MSEPQNVSVLIVDDNRALCDGITRYLVRNGCDVTTASNGVEGLQAVRSQPFDAVISDVNMPQRGGLWLYEQAIALRPQLRGRFVFCSSEPLPDTESMSLCTGFEHFLLKPFSLETMWRDVQEIIQGFAIVPRRGAPQAMISHLFDKLFQSCERVFTRSGTVSF